MGLLPLLEAQREPEWRGWSREGSVMSGRRTWMEDSGHWLLPAWVRLGQAGALASMPPRRTRAAFTLQRYVCGRQKPDLGFQRTSPPCTACGMEHALNISAQK
jgi:hypothetical protein